MAAKAAISSLRNAGSEIVGGGANAVATPPSPAEHGRALHGGDAEPVSTDRTPGRGPPSDEPVDLAGRITASHAEAYATTVQWRSVDRRRGENSTPVARGSRVGHA